MSETEDIEQLWYTWSTTGLDAMPAGIRVRAASPGLTDLNSQRMRTLDRYLRYVLPTGTNRLEVNPQQAPISLAFLRGENGERVLVHKVYTGRDGRNRPGNYFAHLLADLPATFSAREAIALWRSLSWQTTDVPAQGQNGQGKHLQKISLRNLTPDSNPWSRVDKDKMHQYLPQFIQSYLLQRDSVDRTQSRKDMQGEIAELQLQIQKHAKDKQKQALEGLQSTLREREHLLQHLPSREYQRIYLAASADEAAYLVFCLCNVLPTQWLEELTFSTYEQDVQVKHECILINTCLPPTPQEVVGGRTQDVLPPPCYEGLALNCYTGRVSSFYDIPADNPQAVRYASYATDALVTQSIDKLYNFLVDANQVADLTVDTFLRRFYFAEKKTYTREEIVQIFWHPGEFIPVSKEDGFRSAVHQEVILDVPWLRDELKPHTEILYKESRKDHILAHALKNFSLATRITYITYFGNREKTAVFALWELLESLRPVPDTVDFWIELLALLAADISCKTFIQSNWDVRVELLSIAIQVLSCEKNEHLPIIDVLLSCTELEFQRLLQLKLPPEWIGRATKLFDEQTPRLQPQTVHAFEQAKENVSSLITLLLSIPQPGAAYRQIALKLFTKLAIGGYTYLDELQDIWWKQGAAGDELRELVHIGRPGLVESGELLQNYGAQYMRTDETAQIIFPMFQAVATNASDKKLPVLFSLLDQGVGVNELVQLLTCAHLSNNETVNFLARYGPDNKKRYPPYPLLYPQVSSWGEMLVSLAVGGQDILKWQLLTCCLDGFKKSYTAQCDRPIELLLNNAQLNAHDAEKFFKEYGKYFVPFCYHSSIARKLYQSFVKSSNSRGKLNVLWLWFANPKNMERNDMDWLLSNSELGDSERASLLEEYGIKCIAAYPDSQALSGCIEGYLDTFDLRSYRSDNQKKRSFLGFLAHQPSLSPALQIHAQIIDKIVMLAQKQSSLSQKDITEIAGYLYQKREQLLSPVAQVLAIRVQDAVQLGNVVATMQVVFRDDTLYTGELLLRMIQCVQEDIESNVRDDIYIIAIRIAAYLQFLLGDSAVAIMSETSGRQALDLLLQQRRIQILQATYGIADTWLPRLHKKWQQELRSRGLIGAANNLNQKEEQAHLQPLPSPEQIEPTKELQPPTPMKATNQVQPSFQRRLRSIVNIPLEMPLVLSIVWWQLPRAYKTEGTGQLTVIWSRYSALLKRIERRVPEKQWKKLRFAVTFHMFCLLADDASPEASVEAEGKILQLVDDDENKRLYIPSLTWHEKARIELARKRSQQQEGQALEGKQAGNIVQYSSISPGARQPLAPNISHIPGAERPPRIW